MRGRSSRRSLRSSTGRGRFHAGWLPGVTVLMWSTRESVVLLAVIMSVPCMRDAKVGDSPETQVQILLCRRSEWSNTRLPCSHPITPASLPRNSGGNDRLSSVLEDATCRAIPEAEVGTAVHPCRLITLASNQLLPGPRINTPPLRADARFIPFRIAGPGSPDPARPRSGMAFLLGLARTRY